MFSKDITTSDAFREMPTSSQALYFHLGMEADDDGFLDNYRGLMRAINASDDDLKILLGKRFLILFPTLIIVVKHWLLNNTIRKDRYTETKHLDEKRALLIKENGAYTELPVGTPSGNQMATQYRIEEDRIVSAFEDEPRVIVSLKEDGEERTPSSNAKYPHAKEVFAWFPKPQASWMSLKNVQEREYAEYLYERGEKNVKRALTFYEEYKDEPFCPKITKPSDLEKKWLDLTNFAKKLDA